MPIPLFLLTIPTLSTLAGGLLTLRLRRVRALLEALGAGLLLAAALLDLLPEALALGPQAGLSEPGVLGWLLVFVLVFTAVDTALAQWSAASAGQGERRRLVGLAGGAMMIFHSLRDGLAIGAAYAASPDAGYAVALGIAAHDFGDGMNTVLLTTGGARARLTDYVFLAADAVAPFVGGLITVWWLLSPRSTAVLLVLAAGFFLQMSLSDLLPQIRMHPRRRWPLLAAVCAGAGLLALANWMLALR